MLRTRRRTRRGTGDINGSASACADVSASQEAPPHQEIPSYQGSIIYSWKMQDLPKSANTWEDQAQVDSEARRRTDTKLKLVEIDLHAVQLQIEKLEQQKMELSSTARSL
jgi:hypothetical protein